MSFDGRRKRGKMMAAKGSSSAGMGSLAVARLAKPGLLGADGFELSSAAFEDGGELDPCFTAYEEDSVAPPLEWSAPPAAALELALVVECPDTPGSEPACHWLVWGLAPQKGQLLEGEVPPFAGKNSQGNSEWMLPRTPLGEQQAFVFQLFALDTALSLSPGSSRKALFEAMEGHVVGVAMLTALFEPEDEDDEGEWDDVDIDAIDFDGN
jgi:Raf kinase inhibitor-like YbhB/YbcL family protein